MKTEKAQFRRRASAVPNLIAIRLDCGMAETRLWFRRRAIVAPNSGFTEATQQLVGDEETKKNGTVFEIALNIPAEKANAANQGKCCYSKFVS